MQSVLQPAVMFWLIVVLILGAASALWLGPRRRGRAIALLTPSMFAALSATIPPALVPTPGGPGFTTSLEAVLVVTAAAVGLGAGWLGTRFDVRGSALVLLVLILQLASFALGVAGVVISLPHQGGG